MIKTRILQGNLMVLSSHLPQNHSYVTTGWWSQTRSERGGHGKQSKLSVETMQPLRPEWVGEFAHPAVNTRSSIPTGKHHTYFNRWFSLSRRQCPVDSAPLKGSSPPPYKRPSLRLAFPWTVPLQKIFRKYQAYPCRNYQRPSCLTI